MLVRESISQFVRGGDPKAALGIGARVEIEQWFSEWAPNTDYNEDENFNILIDSLNLRRSLVTHLPDNLKVRGTLDLEETQITQLPAGLKVGGDLDLRNTPIKSLPEGLEVGGNLNLMNTLITHLPAGLKKIGGYLDLEGTPITQLPKGLKKIKGYLDIRGTQITQLPDDLEIGGIIYSDEDFEVGEEIFKDF